MCPPQRRRRASSPAVLRRPSTRSQCSAEAQATCLRARPSSRTSRRSRSTRAWRASSPTRPASAQPKTLTLRRGLRVRSDQEQVRPPRPRPRRQCRRRRHEGLARGRLHGLPSRSMRTTRAANGEKNGIKKQLEDAADAQRVLLFPGLRHRQREPGYHIIGWAAFVIDDVVKWTGQEPRAHRPLRDLHRHRPGRRQPDHRSQQRLRRARDRADQMRSERTLPDQDQTSKPHGAGRARRARGGAHRRLHRQLSQQRHRGRRPGEGHGRRTRHPGRHDRSRPSRAAAT